MEQDIHNKLSAAADKCGLDITGGQVRRSSSRFCFGVEHGDYNGMELFGENRRGQTQNIKITKNLCISYQTQTD